MKGANVFTVYFKIARYFSLEFRKRFESVETFNFFFGLQECKYNEIFHYTLFKFMCDLA